MEALEYEACPHGHSANRDGSCKHHPDCEYGRAQKKRRKGVTGTTITKRKDRVVVQLTTEPPVCPENPRAWEGQPGMAWPWTHKNARQADGRPYQTNHTLPSGATQQDAERWRDEQYAKGWEWLDRQWLTQQVDAGDVEAQEAMRAVQQADEGAEEARKALVAATKAGDAVAEAQARVAKAETKGREVAQEGALKRHQAFNETCVEKAIAIGNFASADDANAWLQPLPDQGERG
jgi:hypothetical protein